MVASSKTPSSSAATSATGRMAAVQDMAKLQRILFEVEREFVRTATTLIYRVGEPELNICSASTSGNPPATPASCGSADAS